MGDESDGEFLSGIESEKLSRIRGGESDQIRHVELDRGW